MSTKRHYDKVGRGFRSLDNMIALYHLQEGHCPYTADPLPVPANPTCMADFQDVSVDHIHPVKHGGTNDFDNLCLTTPSMNSAKGDDLYYPHREIMWVI